MTKEVKSLRAAHNFSPDSAICDVAKALRKNLNEHDFENVLTKLPKEAQDYWKV